MFTATTAPLLLCFANPPLTLRSENCTIFINASSGCYNSTRCDILLRVSGVTQDFSDTVTLLVEHDRRLDPIPSEGSSLAVYDTLMGDIDFNDYVSTTTGVLVIQFTSDETVQMAGWTASWVAVPLSTTSCTGGLVVAARGNISDGSGDYPYHSK